MAAVLLAANLPEWWVSKVEMAAKSSVQLPTIIGLEAFSGTGEMSQAFSDVAGTCLTFEKLDSPQQDILKDEGLMLLLCMFCRFFLFDLIHFLHLITF